LLELKLWFGNDPADEAKAPFDPSAALRTGPEMICVARPLSVETKNAFALTEAV
jgi:hypothetical protein